MDSDRWKRTRALFDEAAELPAEQWNSFLERHCDDPDIAADVRELLQADAEAASHTSLSEQAPDLFAGLEVDDDSEEAQQRLGQRYGAWRLVRPLAEGGMGVVYLAERVEGDFTQRAALKVVRNAASNADVLTRFRYERQILANLAHPNIARLLDGGAGQGGEPYLAMEYVEGSDLRSYCDSKALDIDARLRLFLTVCDAVAYAHDRLVLHRDLKPANVLVSQEGEVKLLDFGVAKLIDQQQPAETTVAGRQVFTPEYAAPEQIRGEISTVGVDVYALGVMLYELLTGRRPYRIKGRGAAAIERAVLSTDAPPPSALTTRDGSQHEKTAAEYAVVRSTTPDRLRHQLRGDLDAIVLHALRKTPQERYPTVKAFADDLRAYLQRRPVLARRGSRRYRMLRYVQRHAAAIALGSIAAGSLIAGSVVALWQAREAGIQRDAAVAAQGVSEKEALKSKTTLTFMNRLFEQADPSRTRGETLTAREILDKGAKQVREDLTEQPEIRVEMMTAIGKAQIGLGLYADALPLLKEASELSRGMRALQIEATIRYAFALTLDGKPEEVVSVLEALGSNLPEGEDIPPPLTAKFEYYLAQAYEGVQRIEDAEQAYRRALVIEQAWYGSEHIEPQKTMVAIAGLLAIMGRLDEARGIAERVVNAQRGDESRDDSFFSIALVRLASILDEQGKPATAEPLLREALELRKTVFGADHQNTTTLLGSLAANLAAQGRLDEAIALQQDVLQGFRKNFGNESHWTAAESDRLARMLTDAGRVAEARLLADDSVRVHLATFGENHYRTALALATLGLVALDSDRFDEAQDLLQRALAAWETTLGSESPILAETLDNLAVARMLGGLADPGCEPASRADRLARASTAPDDPSLLYRSAILDACTAAGDPSQWARVEDAMQSLQLNATANPRWARVLTRVSNKMRAPR